MAGTARQAPRRRNRAPASATAPAPPENGGKPAGPDCVPIDSSYLRSLVGYNARRAALAIMEVFGERMAVYDLRPVDFSILSLITHNPGITSRQLCVHLGIQPPNLVAMVATLLKRGLIARRPHPHDGRAMSLYLTAQGQSLMVRAEQTALALELAATSALDEAERAQLIALLQKIYI